MQQVPPEPAREDDAPRNGVVPGAIQNGRRDGARRLRGSSPLLGERCELCDPVERGSLDDDATDRHPCVRLRRPLASDPEMRAAVDSSPSEHRGDGNRARQAHRMPR